MMTVFGRPLTGNRLVLAAVGVAIAGTLGVVGLSGSSGNGSGIPDPPACVTPANQANLTMSGVAQCLDDATDWCAANHPEDDSGTCLDKIYGYIPSDY